MGITVVERTASHKGDQMLGLGAIGTIIVLLILLKILGVF